MTKEIDFVYLSMNCPWELGGFCQAVERDNFTGLSMKIPCEEINCAPLYWIKVLVNDNKLI